MPTLTLVDTASVQTVENKNLANCTITDSTINVVGAQLDGPTIDTPTITGLMTIAGQIKFPATQNPSADVNTLDDYEENTWTPSVGGNATYTVQQGAYTKIGRLVFIQMLVQINVLGTGDVSIVSGLPFTNNGNDHGLAIGSYSSLATNVTALFGRVNAANATLSFFGPAAAAASNTGVSTIFGNGTAITATGFYII